MGRRSMEITEADPKGLLRESFRIEQITAQECRSIFLDWALSLAPTTDPRAAIRAALAQYGVGQPAHPMLEILSEGLKSPPLQPKGRRGGRAGRLAP
jgi:hypothetical protein